MSTTAAAVTAAALSATTTAACHLRVSDALIDRDVGVHLPFGYFLVNFYPHSLFFTPIWLFFTPIWLFFTPIWLFFTPIWLFFEFFFITAIPEIAKKMAKK